MDLDAVTFIAICCLCIGVVIGLDLGYRRAKANFLGRPLTIKNLKKDGTIYYVQEKLKVCKSVAYLKITEAVVKDEESPPSKIIMLTENDLQSPPKFPSRYFRVVDDANHASCIRVIQVNPVTECPQA